jgi:hypothetical protein
MLITAREISKNEKILQVRNFVNGAGVGVEYRSSCQLPVVGSVLHSATPTPTASTTAETEDRS